MMCEPLEYFAFHHLQFILFIKRLCKIRQNIKHAIPKQVPGMGTPRSTEYRVRDGRFRLVLPLSMRTGSYGCSVTKQHAARACAKTVVRSVIHLDATETRIWSVCLSVCLFVCVSVCLSVCLSRWIFSTFFVRFWWKCTQMILTKIWDDTFFIFSNFCLMTS